MGWNIIPYVSVGLLQFGMTPQDVARHIGPPEKVSQAMPAGASQELQEKFAGYTVEFRLRDAPDNMKPAVHYADGKAVAFDLYNTLGTTEINGFRLFEHPLPDALEKLKAMSSHYAEEEDGYVFFDLGISIGKGEAWDEVPPINVFARGEFDDMLEEDAGDDVKIIRK